ncbi:cardiolipin synthase, partial [Lachnotalea glycerini]
GKTAFLGGFNVGKEYIGKDTKFGNWRDTHLKISGSAVTSLGIRFILDWNYAAKENLFKTDKYFETKLKETRGNNGIQIISSGPDSISQNIRNNYVRMINKAKNNIYIQSPYFIPDDVVLDSLKIASMSGIDVRVMIPCMPDHPFVYWATYSYMSDLLSVGAKCYTYDDGFLHAKGMVIDGKVACYGTANMDIRSFKLNFEVNATIYSMETAAKLENIFMSDLAKSTQITPYIYANRPLVIRIKEQVSRLLSPLL